MHNICIIFFENKQKEYTNNSYEQNIKKYALCCEGGGAITCKNELEKINEENLVIVSSQLRQAMMPGWSPSMKVLGMDWSKRHGELEVSCNVDDFVDNANVDSSRFVVVRGAG